MLINGAGNEGVGEPCCASGTPVTASPLCGLSFEQHCVLASSSLSRGTAMLLPKLLLMPHCVFFVAATAGPVV